MLAPYFEVKSKINTEGGLKDSMFESDKVMANRARFFNTMNNFLTWCALRQYINYASRPFRKAHQEFYKGLMGGKSVDQRWKDCVMSTNVALGFALTPSYLAKVSFWKRPRDQVHLMVDSIKAAFKARVNQLHWI